MRMAVNLAFWLTNLGVFNDNIEWNSQNFKNFKTGYHISRCFFIILDFKVNTTSALFKDFPKYGYNIEIKTTWKTFHTFLKKSVNNYKILIPNAFIKSNTWVYHCKFLFHLMKYLYSCNCLWAIINSLFNRSHSWTANMCLMRSWAAFISAALLNSDSFDRSWRALSRSEESIT